MIVLNCIFPVVWHSFKIKMWHFWQLRNELDVLKLLLIVVKACGYGHNTLEVNSNFINTSVLTLI